MAIEFQYYLLIGLVFPLLVHDKKVVRSLTFGGIFAIGVLLGNYISDSFIFFHLPLFLLGFACFLQKTGYISRRELYVKIVILVLTIYIYQHKANAFFAIFAVLAIFTDFDVKWKPLYALGKISYSLYLFHWIIGIELFRKLFVHFNPHASQLEKLLLCLVSIGSCIGFAWLMYETIEKPSLALSKRIKYSVNVKEVPVNE